jgi:Family of unknown function (DUF5329)
MFRWFVSAPWLLLAGAACALPPAAQTEVDQLLAALESSGCEFQRNGSWHSAVEAKGHLLRKLKAIERRGSLDSAEQFITLAATASSSSGKAYQVRCGNEFSTSGSWLQTRLKQLRATKPP